MVIKETTDRHSLPYKAEYVTASFAICHALWLRNLLNEIYMVQKGLTKIHVDNKFGIA